MTFPWWPIFGEMCPWMVRGVGEIPQQLFFKLIIVAEISRAAEISENLRYISEGFSTSRILIRKYEI